MGVAGSPRALRRAPSPSIYELQEFGQEFKTEQGIPKLLKKHECPRLGSRITVLGLEDLRDSAYNSECGTIVGERNGRWVVSLDIMEHGATLLLKPENVRHILASVYTPMTPEIPARGDCSTPGFIRVGKGMAVLRAERGRERTEGERERGREGGREGARGSERER